MKLKIFTGTLALFIVITAVAQKNALESITESDLKAHLEFIASDYMQGRDFGTKVPGLEITADYLKTQCIRLGLKDGADNYFQKVDMISIKPDMENTSFKILGANGNLLYQTKDIFTYPGSMQSETLVGEIVFAGYGWTDTENGYNDFENLDLKDKIVLIMTRNREAAMSSSEGAQSLSTESRKFSRVLMGGAKALVIVPDPLNTDNSLFNSLKDYLSKGIFRQKGSNLSSSSRNIIFAETSLADEILKETGKTLLDFQKQINETGKPASVELKNTIAELILAKKIEDANGKNVIAILEGSDPKLKNECIVMTAHYDHIGITANGEINNGADDNGSGTVAMLEVAEAFTKLKKAPKRSIVFAWLTAEEKGLFGSDFYSKNPVFPLEKTLADINMDMIGRSAEKDPPADADENHSLAGPDLIYLISGKQSSELMKISDDVCKELGLHSSDKLTQPFLTRSDYYNFYKFGIPVIGVSTGLHEDYHKPSDELDKIDYHKMKRVADYCFLLADEVANRSKRIEVDNPAQQ
jgi:hypothetical protein